MNWLRLAFSTIRARLFAGVLALALVPLLIGGIYLVYQAIDANRTSLIERATEGLRATANLKKREVEGYLKDLDRELLQLSSAKFIVAGTADMRRALPLMPAQIGVPIGEARGKLKAWYTDIFAPEYAKKNSDRPLDFAKIADALPDEAVAVQYVYIARNPRQDARDGLVDGGDPSAYTVLHKQLHPQMLELLKHSAFTDLHIADPDTGVLVYTSSKEPDIGTSLLNGPLKATNMAGGFRDSLSAGAEAHVSMSDYAPFYPADGDVSSFLSVPILADGKRIGVLIGQFEIAALNTRMSYQNGWKDVGLGATGESFLVGQDKTPRSIARRMAEAPADYLDLLLKIGVAPAIVEKIKLENSNVSLQPLDTLAVRESLAGKAGAAIYPDFRGVPVLGVYTPVQLFGNRWGLVSELEESEALQPVQALQRRLLLFGAIVLGALALIGLFVALRLIRSINRPLQHFRSTVQRISDGETDLRVSSRANDEIGELARTFDTLLDERVATLRRSADENDRLNISVIEIMQSVAQLSQRDLTVKVPVTADVTGAVSDAINLMTGETVKALKQVAQISSKVAASSERVKQRTDETSRVAQSSGAEAVAASTELAAAARALKDIAEQAQRASRSAEHSQATTAEAMSIVRATVEGISQSRDQIRETEKRIKRLGERSQEISSVVGIIGQIAERTSVLALNASMQAVAAGDAGRGFAVVADEVKRLAENARQATQQIGSLVSAIQADTVETTQAMNNTITQVVDISKLAERAGGQMQLTRSATDELVNSVHGIVSTTDAQSRTADVLLNRARQLVDANEKTLFQLGEQREETDNLQTFSKGLLETVEVFRLPA